MQCCFGVCFLLFLVSASLITSEVNIHIYIYIHVWIRCFVAAALALVPGTSLRPICRVDIRTSNITLSLSLTLSPVVRLCPQSWSPGIKRTSGGSTSRSRQVDGDDGPEERGADGGGTAAAGGGYQQLLGHHQLQPNADLVSRYGVV